jgi:hypothetical protein
MMIPAVVLALAVVIFGLGVATPWAIRKYHRWKEKRPFEKRTITSMSKHERAKWDKFKEKNSAVILKWLKEHGDEEPAPIVRDTRTGEFMWAPRQFRRRNPGAFK